MQLLDAAALTYASIAPDEAAELLGAAEETRRRVGVVGDGVARAIARTALDALAQRLSADQLNQAIDRGRELRLDAALTLVRSLSAPSSQPQVATIGDRQFSAEDQRLLG